jgi:hypothetical protein
MRLLGSSKLDMCVKRTRASTEIRIAAERHVRIARRRNRRWRHERGKLVRIAVTRGMSREATCRRRMQVDFRTALAKVTQQTGKS